jgi:hypothetical protein
VLAIGECAVIAVALRRHLLLARAEWRRYHWSLGGGPSLAEGYAMTTVVVFGGSGFLD